MADEASLALVGAFIELEDFKSVDKLSARFAKLYPKSTYLRQLPVRRGAGQFPPRPVRPGDRGCADDRQCDLQGRRRRADQPSPNKWQALYILGQIYDARRQPGQGARILQAGRRPLQRRRRCDPGLHAQGPEGARGVDREAAGPAAVVARPAGEHPRARLPRHRRRRCSRRTAARAARQAGHRPRLSQYRPGGRQGLPGRPDAALSHPAQPERDLPASTWRGSRRWSRRPSRWAPVPTTTTSRAPSSFR